MNDMFDLDPFLHRDIKVIAEKYLTKGQFG